MIRIETQFGADLLQGDWLEGASGPLLVLHGAGRSSRAHWRKLRQALGARDFASAAFDFVGHGETGGALLGSSLAHRVEQALAFARAMPRPPVAILGASMGAYVAVRLLESLASVSRLILVVPGVYATEAFRLPFGPAFSDCIRRPRSWAVSDAFARLAAWPGGSLILAAQDDKVIPREIPLRLAAVAQSGELEWLPGGHQFAADFPTQAGAQQRFHERITSFLS